MTTTTLRRRKSVRRPILLVALVLGAVGAPARACDVCAVYTATELRERRTGFRLGVAEQYSRFTTLQEGGHEVSNPAGEYLNSSITQVVAGYNFTPRVGVQLNLPIIARNFRRLENGRAVRDGESGIGDLALLANVLAFSHVTEASVFRFSLLGGLELPSGDPDRLGDEREHHHEHTADEHMMDVPESGIHGHDLALGSGSVDGIVGGALFWSWRRLFWTAAGQYAIRTEGDFDYRYANDLVWQTGPGVMALLGQTHSFGVQAVLAGDTRGKDEVDGMPLDDTALTSVYAGPGLTFTWGTSLDAELYADLPLVENNTGLMIVADWRLRGGVTWRF
jgi:hypothetical protein